MTGVSPTVRSLKALRAEGYTCAVVEYYNSFTHSRHDLFGIIDILALKDGETLAVQTTSRDNMSARVHKITESPNIAAMRAAGWRVHVHGWGKVGTPPKMNCRIIDMTDAA